MPVPSYQKGDSFPIQFVWQLPDGDYIRAVFTADVLTVDSMADKYTVRLRELIAGRQESAAGQIRRKNSLTKAYWQLVGRLQGRRVTIAFEGADGRPLHLRLETLTGEHNFFFRFDE